MIEPAQAMSISRILVPVDYSEHSRAAVEYGGHVAERFGATLDVIHVWDRPSYVPAEALVAHAGGKKSLVDMIRENAEAEMSEFLATCQAPAGVALTHHLESGEPASTILRVAGERAADLIVAGTHGRTGVRHLLLGSVAEKLVRLAKVPVLTVPAP